MKHRALVFLAMFACGEKLPPTVPPPTTATPSPSVTPAPTPDPTLASTPTPAPTPPQNPVTALFIDLTSAGPPYKSRGGGRPPLAAGRGTATASGDQLGAGDVLVAQGSGEVAIKGTGLAVLATVDAPCTASVTPFTKKVIKASA